MPLFLLRKHSRLVHGTTPATKARFNVEMLAEARYHRCRHPGCGTAVLCDRHYICLHLKAAHGLSFAEYCRMPMLMTKKKKKKR